MIRLKTRHLIMVLITILGISIGYSSLNTELRVSGEAKVSVSSDVAGNKILGDNGSKELIESKGEPDFSKIAITDEGMFAAEDNDGTSYYYRGAVENNWLYFAEYYWRIIRINGDGSIRIIYNGKTSNQTGEDTQIGTSAFNNLYDQSEYVGLKYTLGEQHGNSINSVILNVLNDWYEKNLLNYSDYINDSGFCGDRTSTTSSTSAPDGTGGIGNVTTYYGSRYRLYNNKQPTLQCPDVNGDLYTALNNSFGNKALNYPIGLISADEVAFAGGVHEIENNSYYLYTNQDYWTISPCGSPFTRLFAMFNDGSFTNGRVYNSYGVRPVINLKKDVILSGNGTRENPYRIVN